MMIHIPTAEIPRLSGAIIATAARRRKYHVAFWGHSCSESLLFLSSATLVLYFNLWYLMAVSSFAEEAFLNKEVHEEVPRLGFPSRLRFPSK